MANATTVFYCVKCKEKVTTDILFEGLTKNNRRIAKGECPKCKTKVNKFLPKAK